MNLRNFDRFTPFAVGLAIGITATLLLAPESGGNTRNQLGNAARRVGNGLKARAEELGREGMAAGMEDGGWRTTMSDMKDKAKHKIDDAADAAKQAADRVVDKSKDLAHSAGKKMKEEGSRLQDA